jgi:hypothetical protein
MASAYLAAKAAPVLEIPAWRRMGVRWGEGVDLVTAGEFEIFSCDRSQWGSTYALSKARKIKTPDTILESTESRHTRIFNLLYFGRIISHLITPNSCVICP